MRILGVDLGGTNVDVVVYDNDKFEYVCSRKTDRVISTFTEFLSELVEKTNAKLVGIGIAAWLRKGKPVFAPNIEGLEKLSFDSFPIKIVLENDANCFALYASKELAVRNLLGVTVGTGVGSGIIFEGKIYRGAGMAGEIGHVTVIENGRPCGCGERGHLEAYFGGRAFSLEGKEAKELVESGDIYATEGFLLFCRTLANAIRLLDPEVVALGGRIGMNLDVKMIKDCVHDYLPKFYDVEVVAIKDELSVAKGACLACLQQRVQ